MRVKTRAELPWLYYPRGDRVLINAHNFTPSVDLLTGLRWYWDLDAAGATITDSQSGLVLTKGGTVTVVSGGAPDGGDCISVGNGLGYYAYGGSLARTIDTEQSFSINVWSYSTGTSSSGNWIINHRGSNGSTSVHWQLIARENSLASDLAQCRDAAGSARNASSAQTAINTWVMLTAVFTPNTAYLYKNGVLVGSDSSALGARLTTAQPFAIGTSSWALLNANTTHRGRLFAAGVWNVGLNATQITTLYNSGAGKRFAAL